MAEGVLPIISLGSIDRLTKLEDIAAYLIKYSLLAPGFTSSLVSHELVSFRTLEAQFGHSKEMLANAYGIGLTSALKRYAGTESVGVDCSAEDIDGIRYKLTVRVVGSNGNLLLSHANINVDSNNINITFQDQ